MEQGVVMSPTQTEQMRDIVLNYIHMLTANEVPYNTAARDTMLIEARLLLDQLTNGSIK